MKKKFLWALLILTFLPQQTSLIYATDKQENSGEIHSGSRNKISQLNKDENFFQLLPLNSILIKDFTQSFEIRELKFTESQIKEILESATDLISEFDERIRIYSPFIICRKIHHEFNESMFPGNLPDFCSRTIVKFGEDGLLYQNSSILNSSEEGAWALNPKGKMCVFFRDKFPNITAQTHHSFFFKKEGLAKPVACAGNIEVHNGKITKINNDSGRYQPSDIQLLLAVKYLFFKGVVDYKVRGELVVKDKVLSLGEMIVIAHSLDLK